MNTKEYGANALPDGIKEVLFLPLLPLLHLHAPILEETRPVEATAITFYGYDYKWAKSTLEAVIENEARQHQTGSLG